jgi:hypothetical protein
MVEVLKAMPQQSPDAKEGTTWKDLQEVAWLD